MINDLKLGLKTIKYAHGVKSNLAGSIIMIAVGLFLYAVNIMMEGYIGVPGGIFMILSAMFPVQMIFSLSASNLVQSSPAKKRMQTSVPAMISCGGMLVMYVLYAGMGAVLAVVRPQNISKICNEFVTMSLFAFLIMLYIAVAYKYFWVSCIMFLGVYSFTYCGMVLGNGIMPDNMFSSDAGSFLLAMGIGLAIIVAGGFAQYGISLLVYKAPMSKMAQAASLRKSL